jgi:hypothetical protein
MDPVQDSFSLSLNSTDIAVQTESPWSTWTMRRLCAQHKTATTDHVFLCTDTVHAVRVQLTRQIPFCCCRRCRHSFQNSSVVACSAASQYNVLPKKFNQYLFIPPPLNVDRSTHCHFTLLFSLLPTLLSSINLVLPKIRGQTSTTSTFSFHRLAKWAEKSQSQSQLRSRRPVDLRRRIIHGPS